MPDFEKVKDGLEHCSDSSDFYVCEKCAYWDDFNGCMLKLKKDALQLIINQQEEIRKLRTQLDEAMLWR